LTWSHYRAAKAAGTRDKALTLLGKAADNGWFSDDIDEAIKTGAEPPAVRPRKLDEIGGEYVRAEAINGNEQAGFLVTFRTTRPPDITERRVYTMKIYGVA